MPNESRIGRAVAALLTTAVVAGCGTAAAGNPYEPAPPGPRATASASAAPPRVLSTKAASRTRPRPAATQQVPVFYPARGSGTFATAPAQPGAAKGSGRLWRYRVSVETDIGGLPADEFAAAVSSTLDDPRGWAAGGTLRLHRVGAGESADFVIYLATPGTRDALCDDVDGYTSCRNGDKVVLNVARWATGVPDYDADLATYRRYMVNHEVGHRLGHGHELCPAPGEPAPVMQQQTLGMHGCLPNAWPYLDGKRYAGVSGAYDDATPPASGGSS